ncbi:MAG: glycosyltransferase family 39 protein [Anaerolineae bacterium]|nr:glycosyltransferase family 39 protein [Anaerolineae bacterium]
MGGRVTLTAARRPRPGRVLWVIVAVFVTLGMLYALTTPLFETPDESSHLQVIHYLSRYRRLPAPVLLPHRITTGAAMAESLRYHEPPLYYTPPLYHSLAALLTAWTPMEDLPARLIPNPAWEVSWSPQRNADPHNKNVFVHLPGETWSGSATWRAALALRLLSVVLGVVTVVCAYRSAQTLFPDRPELAAGAAALVAFNPQFVAASASVSNDPLLIAMSSLFVALALCAMRDSAGWRCWAALGALVGAGLWVKQSALLLLPVGALAILGQSDAGRFPWRKLLGDALALGMAATAVGCAWYVHNAVSYGDVSGLRPHFVSQMPLAQFGLRELATVFETYWAGFGWALLSAPWPVYAGLGVMAALAAGGLLRMVLPGGSWHSFASFTRRGLGVLAALWLLNALSLVRWSLATGSPYGRLLFPSQTAAGMLLACGLAQCLPARAARAGLGLIGAALAMLAALVPWTLLAPAFASPQVVQIPVTTQSLDAAFAGGPVLRGYAVSQPAGGSLRSGDTLALTLYWEATQTAQPRYQTWMHLTSLDPMQRIAGDDAWLGGTLYPADFWRRGDRVRQTHRLELPEQVPFGLYWIRLGLSDDQGTRIPPIAGGDQVTLGPWRVRPTRAVAPAYLLDCFLGEAVLLRGYDVSLGESLVVTLTWQARSVPANDYTVFVHWVDETGVSLSQHDGIPSGDRYPTTWWLPGDVVPDVHRLPLPTPLPEEARLEVGMYLPTTGDRLPAFDKNGTRLPDDMIRWAWQW